MGSRSADGGSRSERASRRPDPGRQLLTEAASHGRLTLEQYEDRLSKAYAAKVSTN